VRVLIFSQYFAPEIGATQARVAAFAEGLAARGHDVEVICEVPNHPQGVVRDGYAGRPLVRGRTGGYRVKHVWVRTQREKTRLGRIAFYGSYAAMAAVVGSSAAKPDVVLASSPPLPVAAAAAVVAARHRVPWVLDVRDLWPEAAVALGELSGARPIAAAQALADRLYRSASRITVVTEPFQEAIAKRIDDPEKISLVPNGTTQFWLDGSQLEPDRAELGLPTDQFVWTFAGNVGLAQGLDAAIDAAGMLGEEFRLLIVGDGPARSRLEEQASNLPPGRVEFRDQCSPVDARKYLRASDALLVSLAADPALRDFVPSKLYDFCAVGRPVIVAAVGEAQRLTTPREAAVTVPPGDPGALSSALLELRSDPLLRDRLAAAGAHFGAQNERERQVERLADLLASART
jgi:glycosyltransferase involved in cell wall biosynthesis